MHAISQKIGDYIRRDELINPGDRIGVAVSGGIDSVALLRILLELRSELGVVLFVVHLNHMMRGAESNSDEEFVAQLARKHKLEFHSATADVTKYAAEHHVSLETAARRARYDFFTELLADSPEDSNPLSKIATGHTLDDQAETVLMRVIRGTGMRGLSAIRPHLEVEDFDGEIAGEIVRPLLGVRRHELEQYLREMGQTWREDSTNRDSKFTRNRVRHTLLPLLEREFNPAVAENLAELAEISYGEEDFWENEVAGWMGTRIHWTEPDWAARSSAPKDEKGLVQLKPFHPEQQKNREELDQRLEEAGPLVMNASVDLMWFLAEPLAVQRRVVKAVGEYATVPFEFKHVERVIALARNENGVGKKLALPLGWVALREAEGLLFLTPDLRTTERLPLDYEYKLSLPGRAIVPEARVVIEALVVALGVQSRDNDPEHTLDAKQLSRELVVRNWRPGDRFWPAHTKSPKKIKELLQALHIPQTERRRWPVVVSGTEIVWVPGFPVAAKLHPNNSGEEGYVIRQLPLDEATEVED